MLLGGERHGQDVEIGDEAKTYVDMAHGVVYVVKEVASQHPSLPPNQVSVREVLVHEGLVAGGPEVLQGAIVDAVMGQWFLGGFVRELPEQPADNSPLATRERVVSAGLVLP